MVFINMGYYCEWVSLDCYSFYVMNTMGHSNQPTLFTVYIEVASQFYNMKDIFFAYSWS